MAKVIIMPKLGFTQEEGTLVEWHKKTGDFVSKGEAFFDVHTDKSIITVDAAESGTLLKIVVEPGMQVPVFTPLAVLGESGENPDLALESHVLDVAPDTAVKDSFLKESLSDEENDAKVEKDPSLKLTPKARKLIDDENYALDSIVHIKGTGFNNGITAKDIRTSPLARKVAKNSGVDIGLVSGSGSNGKIESQDILRFKKAGDNKKTVTSKHPYAGTRKIIGDRLSKSKFTAPHVYFSDSIDATKLIDFRNTINKKNEYKISVSDILILAAGKALQKFPMLNSSLTADQIVCYGSINIGTAIAGSSGLVVPVIKNVQDKSLREIAAETRDLFGRAKNGRLSPEEYSDGTFTISNLGAFGIGDFTAIINPPEVSILAVGAIKKAPVVFSNSQGKDEITIRPMMNIRLSVDHRVADGLLAVQFVEYIKELLEEPVLTVV